MAWQHRSDEIQLAPEGWHPAFPNGDCCIITNEKVIWSRTDLSSGRGSCKTALCTVPREPPHWLSAGAIGRQLGTNPSAGPAMFHPCYFKCMRTARKEEWLRNERNQHVYARKPAGPMLERPFSSSLSLPAALPVIYMSVIDTRIGPCIFKHRLPASCCSHSLSLLEAEDFQNSLIDFFFLFFFPPPFAVCISLSLVGETSSKRGAVSLSHSNAPQLLDQRRIIDFAFKYSCSIRAPQSLAFK